MADDELIIPIDKAFWPRGVLRGLSPLLRSLGDKHGNLVIAAVPNKHIMVKGPADRIEGVKAPLRELFEEHFPDAPVPEELGGEGEGQWEGEEVVAEGEGQAVAQAPLPKISPKTTPAAKPSQPAAPSQSVAASTPVASSVQPDWLQRLGGLAETASAAVPAPERKRVAELVAPVMAAKLVAAGTSGKPVKGRKQPRPAAMIAPDLLWECVRKNSSFLRKPTRHLKRSHRPFSVDPCNLLGIHSLKFSGVATEALNVRPVANGNKESIQLLQSHAKTSRQRRPKSATVTTGLSKCSKRGLARLDQEVDGKLYRRDLLDLAKVKYSKIQQSFKTKKRIVKSRRAKI